MTLFEAEFDIDSSIILLLLKRFNDLLKKREIIEIDLFDEQLALKIKTLESVYFRR